jgi:hypothetical protein
LRSDADSQRLLALLFLMQRNFGRAWESYQTAKAKETPARAPTET